MEGASRRDGPALLEPDLSLVSWQDADHLFDVIRASIVEVRQPLVLISQAQRSGGTLTSTLLDGHPELHAHPYELLVGHPGKADWPSLNGRGDADDWVDLLREQFVRPLFLEGYRKKPDMRLIDDFPTLPFTVVPSFLDRLFRLLCADDAPRDQRQILDRYFTAFFNAWIDCQGLRETPKRWVVAFGPRLAWGESRTRFLSDYPDGRIVSIHRDPRAWYASASRFSSRYGEFDEALALWRRGAEEAMAAKKERPESVFVLTYEALVRNLEPTMQALAAWLGIEWDPLLLRPTFNRLPTVPNSSYRMLDTGVRPESLDRWREILDAGVIARIEAEALELDAAVRSIADVA